MPVACRRDASQPHARGIEPPVTCEQCSKALADYLEGLLPAAERAAFEAHLAACNSCRQLVRELRALPGLVRRATHASLPAGARQRLVRRLRAARKKEE
jgi:anti-sigma factor RsiW